ncbi:dockerin type I domain-containing protein [Ruminococcus albus]|uniref:Dockerin domain-containing protein n=1 Tax=Ruminococcus albus TaxID=1264 RepID=A0A1I1RDS1_RUMAL|nr:dockerin type I domain-containing protein [Ruminococcus albus]SFD32267.1 hypothetical protein SAMN02910406_03663 [Ruminococcus albus]
MKKSISIVTALAALLSCCSMTAIAETSPKPADVDETVYSQLLKEKYLYDSNSDGVITDDELAKAYQLYIDLDGISDLSWVSKMKSCEYVVVSNGSITDFSPLKKMPALRELDMREVPITDISFIYDLDLDYCWFYKMDQITPEQRLEVVRFFDLELPAGTSAKIECKPKGFVDYDLSIADKDTAVFIDGTTSTNNVDEDVYGNSVGKTTYTVSVDGKDYYTRNIVVKDPHEAYDPSLSNTVIENFEVGYSSYYNPDTEKGSSDLVALLNGTLYTIKGTGFKAVETDVADYEHYYERTYNKDYNYADMVLKNNGTLLVNGEKITDIKVKAMRSGYFLGKDGSIYTLVSKGNGFTTAAVATDSKGWIDSCEPFYISKDGNIKYYSKRLISDGRINAYTGNTNIGEPVSAFGLGSSCFVLDSIGTLYEISYSSSLSKEKIADSVVSVQPSDDGSCAVYTKKDGTVAQKQRSGYSNTDEGANVGLNVGTFYIHEYQSRGISENDAVFDYYIDKERTMRLLFLGDWCGLTNVESAIGSTYDKKQDHGYVYFLRTDGSVWRYDLDDKYWQKVLSGTIPVSIEKKYVKGDVDGDGELTILDIALVERFIAQNTGYIPDRKYNVYLPNRGAGDIYKDNKINAIDLEFMKKELLKSKKGNK